MPIDSEWQETIVSSILEPSLEAPLGLGPFISQSQHQHLVSCICQGLYKKFAHASFCLWSASNWTVHRPLCHDTPEGPINLLLSMTGTLGNPASSRMRAELASEDSKSSTSLPRPISLLRHQHAGSASLCRQGDCRWNLACHSAYPAYHQKCIKKPSRVHGEGCQKIQH